MSNFRAKNIERVALWKGLGISEDKCLQLLHKKYEHVRIGKLKAIVESA